LSRGTRRSSSTRAPSGSASRRRPPKRDEYRDAFQDYLRLEPEQDAYAVGEMVGSPTPSPTIVAAQMYVAYLEKPLEELGDNIRTHSE
jgi:hypothetical protein